MSGSVQEERVDPTLLLDSAIVPEDLTPEVSVSVEEFVYRVQMFCRRNSRHSVWQHDHMGRRSAEATGYPNYFAVRDNVYRNASTGEIVFLYIPRSSDLTSDIKEEAAITISKMADKQLGLVRQWLGLDAPNSTAYLAAWLKDPRNRGLYRNYMLAVHCDRERARKQATT